MNVRAVLKRCAVYTPLAAYAVITLIPFAYMFCAAFKPIFPG